MNTLAPPPRWVVPEWESIAGLRYGFFGRAGGVSRGAFAGLNCSGRVGDESSDVSENLARACRTLACERIVLPRQVHGDRIATVQSSTDEVGEADALVVASPGVAAGVLTADCVPLLLIVPRARLAAAVHAGWKGTALGIARGALDHLVRASGEPASGVHAALGPAIGCCCFEVGEEVVTAIDQGLGRGAVARRERRGSKSWIDLREINAALLRVSGIPAGQIHSVGPCTRCAPEQCFSHRGFGGVTGRQLSAVAWHH